MPRLSSDEQVKITKECIDDFNNYLNRWPDPIAYGSDSGHLIEWEGEGAIVKDITGREILDFLGGYGIFSLGHRHPKVIRAVKAQLDRLALHSQKLLNPITCKAARCLAEITPGSLRKTFFCNSGTEAIEGALKLARLFTKKHKFISALNSFHGKTMGALSVTGRQLFRDPVSPLLPVEFVPFGDAEALENKIEDDVAAVILEPIQGEGGVIVPPDSYLRDVREICTRNNVLFIADEVQTGLGRTGKMFCVDHHEIVPDILCLGKALSGGVIPVAAFTTTDEIWSAYHVQPLFHTSTFGSNPLACTAAEVAIEVTKEEALASRAAKSGHYLIDNLRQLAVRHTNLIKEIRGKGLLIGVEMTNEPIATAVANALFKRHVLVAYTLNKPEVIRIEPPLIINNAHSDMFLERLDDSLSQVNRES